MIEEHNLNSSSMQFGQWNALSALLVVLILSQGCSPVKPALEDETKSPAVRDLSSFPQINRMLLGEFQARVKPLISIPVSAASDGDIHFHVNRTRQMLEKGTLWAEVEPEQLAGEKQELALNTRNEKLRLEEEIQLAERELEKVEYMLSDPALRDIRLEDGMPLSTNLVRQLRSQVELLQEQLQACGVVELLELEQKALRSRLEMPFDGELLVSLPVTPERQVIRVANNTPVGIMRDISEIHLHIVVRDPELVAIPPEKLFVEVKRDRGSFSRGRFHDSLIVEVSNQDVLVYRFGFPPEDSGALVALIGANLTCDLWVESERALHSVAKLDAARMLDGRDSFSGWRDAVEALWPGAELLYTGRSHLGIAVKGAAE